MDVQKLSEKNKYSWLSKESVLFLGLLLCGVFAPQIFHLVGQQALGTRISPMHVFVLMCGLVCGKKLGALCGFIMPFLSSLIFGMPTIYPTAIAMAFEMLVYGYVTGLLRSRVHFVVAILVAMAGGRIMLCAVNFILFALDGGAYGFSQFFNSIFVFGWPAIICSFTIVSLVTFVLVKAKIISFGKKNA